MECAHGTFPVPAPATARLLEGVPVYAGAVATELVTPTGALLVTGYAASYAPLPPMRDRRRSATAPATATSRAIPNVLRVIVGEDDAPAPVEQIVVLECEIDDMNPQLFGPLMERLHAGGRARRVLRRRCR